MEVTEVRVRLISNSPSLMAFASVTFDACFVVHGIKIIKTDHDLIVAMPNREVFDKCFSCLTKNTLRQRYCGECGRFLDRASSKITKEGDRHLLHKDICHPINHDCREVINQAVLNSYWEEKGKAS